MKKITLLMVFIISMNQLVNAQSLKDTLVYLNGKKEACQVIKVDPSARNLVYTSVNSRATISFDKLSAYVKDGSRVNINPIVKKKAISDVINLKSGKVINCTISSLDTVQKTIVYVKDGEIRSVPLSSVGSYTKDGSINAGLAKLPQSIISDNADDIKDTGAGEYLIKFSKNAQTGLGMQILGSSLLIVGTFSKDEDGKKLITAVGTGISLIGTIVFISSFSQSRKAGEILKVNNNVALKVTDSGIGFALKL